MNKFLIQTINGEITFDFQWELIQAIKGANWLHNKIIYEYILSDVDIPNCIPIGSVEFTLNYMQKYHNKIIKPIHIPPSLFKEEYLKRKCEILHHSQINITQDIFIKSIDVIKGFTSIIKTKNQIPTSGNYFISELINIDSEWRAFIYKNELVGLQNYLGDFTLFPNVKLIKEMIYNYKEAPSAYTLDVGINENGTFLIEIGEIFSSSLYGWSNHQLLPLMYKSWFRKCVK